MKKLFFFVPVFLFLASCVKEEATPKPQKALITEVKIVKFPTTDNGKSWDANALNTTSTAPDMYFEVTNSDAAKTVIKSRNSVKYVDNVTTVTLPTWTIDPKLELATLSERVNFDFYDQDSGILDSNDDLMGTCTLDMTKETISGSTYPKTITIDNGAGLSITISLEYVY